MKAILKLSSLLALTICQLNWVVSAQSEDRHHPLLKLEKSVSTKEQDAKYWRNIAEQEIEATKNALNAINTNIAKNIIIFVGDGMSLPTLTASRIYKAQYEARKVNKTANGEESLLTFEKFPHVGLSRTYCVDAQTPDSAATANAMFTGVKTNYYTMGFDNTVDMGNVSSEADATKVDSILQWAQDAGKDTGFVTTTRISHATPGALYAHSAERYWECNKNSSDGSIDSTDITAQFVTMSPGNKVKVALGGGRASFLPSSPTEEETAEWGYPEDEWDCTRMDNQNLVKEYMNKSQLEGFEGARVKVVKDRGQLSSINIDDTDYLLGLFGWGYMKYEHQREELADKPEGEPSLAEMTEVAIKMLQKSENGFFLMVEGGKIDVAHHDGWANVALHETMAMDKAVEKALSLVDTKDTLIIVTADHGHTMSMGGYQTRGADIRGIVDNELGKDNKTYSILSYANGPGFYDHLYVDENSNVSRIEITETNFTSFEIHQPSSAPLKSETHSGADVGIFAIGPYAHFFRSVHEQNYIAYVMAYSACIGPYKDNCHFQSAASTTTTTSSIILLLTVFLMSYFN